MGILTVAVILMAVQGITPVMAEGGGHGNGGDGNGGGDGGGAATLAIFVMHCEERCTTTVASGNSVCWKIFDVNSIDDCTQTYRYITVRPGTSIKLAATAASGFTFGSWRVSNVNDMTMPANSALMRPTSTSASYTLTIASGTNYQAVIAIFRS